MRKILIYIIYLLSLSIACSSTAIDKSYSFNYKGEIKSGAWLRNLKVEYTAHGAKFHALAQIYFPSQYKKGDNLRTLIVLHEYNETMREWEVNTNIEKYADDYNFILVCPNMRTSLYESKFYPETTNRWAEMPGGKFIGEVLINYIRKNFAIGSTRDKTGIFGVANGARGALLVSSKYYDIFSVSTGMSGNYDSLSMTRNKRLISVYGEFKRFKERWEQDDNIIKLAVNLKNTSVYLWHGVKDYNIPREHSVMLAMRLKHLQKNNGGYEIIYKENKYYTCEWKHWRRILPEVMEFFDKKLLK